MNEKLIMYMMYVQGLEDQHRRIDIVPGVGAKDQVGGFLILLWYVSRLIK